MKLVSGGAGERAEKLALADVAEDKASLPE